MGFLSFFFEKASFCILGKFPRSGSTAKNRVYFHHFQVKLVRVKNENFFKNAYFLPIFTANHSIYVDSQILWIFYEFKRNLLGIYGVFSIFIAYGMYGMCSAFTINFSSLQRGKFPKTFLFPSISLFYPFNFLLNSFHDMFSRNSARKLELLC